MNILAGDLIPLPDLPAALLAFANKADPVEVARCGYQSIWRRARNGSIQAQRLGAGLFVEKAQVEQIARSVLSLTGQPNARNATAKPSRARRVVPSSNVGAAA